MPSFEGWESHGTSPAQSSPAQPQMEANKVLRCAEWGRTDGTRELTGTEAAPGGQQQDGGGRHSVSQSVSQSVSSDQQAKAGNMNI